MPYSHKKVWWKCEKGHEWQIAVAARTKKKSGCPYCSGRLASDDNCLQTLYPELAKEWHSGALQLRFLQTLTEIATEKNSTIIFPVPLDLLKPFLDKEEKD